MHVEVVVSIVGVLKRRGNVVRKKRGAQRLRLGGSSQRVLRHVCEIYRRLIVNRILVLGGFERALPSRDSFRGTQSSASSTQQNPVALAMTVNVMNALDSLALNTDLGVEGAIGPSTDRLIDRYPAKLLL